MSKLFDLSRLVSVITPPITIVVNLFGHVDMCECQKQEKGAE